jgi:hypothetical protein
MAEVSREELLKAMLEYINSISKTLDGIQTIYDSHLAKK